MGLRLFKPVVGPSVGRGGPKHTSTSYHRLTGLLGWLTLQCPSRQRFIHEITPCSGYPYWGQPTAHPADSNAATVLMQMFSRTSLSQRRVDRLKYAAASIHSNYPYYATDASPSRPPCWPGCRCAVSETPSVSHWLDIDVQRNASGPSGRF